MRPPRSHPARTYTNQVQIAIREDSDVRTFYERKADRPQTSVPFWLYLPGKLRPVVQPALFTGCPIAHNSVIGKAKNQEKVREPCYFEMAQPRYFAA